MTRSGKGKARTPQIIERQDLQPLFDILAEDGYRLIGPTVHDHVLVYADIASVSDLPIGWTDEQDKGSYRLRQSDSPALFGCNLGPHSWKKVLYPAAVRLWQSQRSNGTFHITPETHQPERLALIGVRACELEAIAIQDRVLTGGMYIDTLYQAQRANLFVVAVNCGQAGHTCFCASMHSGPRATHSFDLALTEVVEPDRHYFVVEVGSDLGADVLSSVPHRPATEAELGAAQAIVERTTAQMGRTLDTHRLKERLYAGYDHPHWDTVAARCPACGNCTLVCPTCFCTTVEDQTALTGETATRWRRWDSCFTTDFSYIVGGSIRPSVRSRYRQWLTHKLATWQDQFGTLGCVGCGRCITWCPVGIDLTEEAQAIQTEIQPGSRAGRKRKDENT